MGVATNLTLSQRRLGHTYKYEPGCLLERGATYAMTYVVVPIAALDASARQALAHAHVVGSVDRSVVAVCFADSAARAEGLRHAWSHSGPDAELVIIEAPSETAEASLMAYLDVLQASDASRQVTVLIPRDGDGPAWNFAAGLRHRPGIVMETVPPASASRDNDT